MRYSSDFEDWLSGEGSPRRVNKSHQLSVHARNGADTTVESVDQFIQYLVEDSDEHLAISLNGPQPGITPIVLNLPPKNFSSITMEGGISNIWISGAITPNFIINNSNVAMILESSKIGRVQVKEGMQCDLMMANNEIGTLEIGSGSITNLSIEDCLILDIKCPPPEKNNPFTGSVFIDRETYFHTDKGVGRRFSGPQSFTSIRAHLEELQNAPMSALFRAYELKAERHGDKGLNKFSSWLYDLSANYGLSPGRPLWLLALPMYLLVAVIVFYFDGGSIASGTERYQGYLALMVGICPEPFIATNGSSELCSPRLARSLFLPLQSIGGPLVFFSAFKLVVANNFWVAGLLLVQGLFTDLMIFISILSIRRRFKLT